MIKETIEKNEEIKVNTKEIEILRKHFPACFDKDGKFDIKVFEELIKKEDVDIKKEGYSLNFLGKSYARYLSSLDSETVIVPDKENKNIESENIYIVGDNLDALQHLKYSYSEKIKCIYIDPPYNTGNDGFVYNDKFEFTAEELAKKINIEEDEAERILNLQGKSTHSAWLAFMYPRLELARELLSDDGVIFISIDDNEQSNLKNICDEIFGDSNFIATVPRITKKAGKTTDAIALNHDYVLVYSKSKDVKFNLQNHTDDGFKFEDEHVKTRGMYKLNQTLDYDSLQYSPSLDYPIQIEGEIFYPGGSEEKYNMRKKGQYSRADWAWRWSKKLFDFGIKNDFIVVKKYDTHSRIYTKTYQKASIEKEGTNFVIKQNERKKPLSSLELIANSYSNDNAKKNLLSLFKTAPFDYSKPISLIKFLVEFTASKNDFILDFFSGSATTAHAVMKLNAEDGGNRKYIMVQLDEPIKDGSVTERTGYKTIDEIGRERIRRAAAKIKEEEPEKSKNIDLGFKTYYLKEADKNTLDKIRDFNPDMPFDAGDIKDKFGIDTIIETWKIKDGFGFNAKVEKINLSGYTAYKLSDSEIGEYLYLLDEMEDAAIKELVRKIEAFELNIDKIIEYGYSFSYNANTALRANLKTLKNKNAIDVIIRY